MGVSPSQQLDESFSVNWERIKIDRELLRELHKRSDTKAFVQAGGWVVLLFTWATLALYSWAHWYPLVTLLFVMLYGIQANFCINGMHELGHGAMFETKSLNVIFLRLISFLGWLHPDMFFSSHLRHHRYTLWFPKYDQENPLPISFTLWDFFSFGFINVSRCYNIIKQTIFVAIGHYPTGHMFWPVEWEKVCYPPDQPHLRRPAMQWAQFMLAGHSLITIVSIMTGYWLVPVIFCLGPFYCGFVFFLCNNTQHVGLQPNTTDFRLCCRTFILNPIIRVMYWHMNYHIEHHMYANVPCYNLDRLHQAIKHELPPAPDGIVAVWEVIFDAVQKQKKDPTYVQPVVFKKSLSNSSN